MHAEATQESSTDGTHLCLPMLKCLLYIASAPNLLQCNGQTPVGCVYKEGMMQLTCTCSVQSSPMVCSRRFVGMSRPHTNAVYGKSYAQTCHGFSWCLCRPGLAFHNGKSPAWAAATPVLRPFVAHRPGSGAGGRSAWDIPSPSPMGASSVSNAALASVLAAIRCP